MVTIVICPRAQIDIDEAWDYIAEDSELQADGFIVRLNEKFKLVAGQPDMGRLREDLMPDVRSFPFERYMIYTFHRRMGSMSSASCTARGTLNLNFDRKK